MRQVMAEQQARSLGHGQQCSTLRSGALLT